MKAIRALVLLRQQGFDSVGRPQDVIVLAHPTECRGRYRCHRYQRAQCVPLKIRLSLHFLWTVYESILFLPFLPLILDWTSRRSDERAMVSRPRFHTLVIDFTEHAYVSATDSLSLRPAFMLAPAHWKSVHIISVRSRSVRFSNGAWVGAHFRQWKHYYQESNGFTVQNDTCN